MRNVVEGRRDVLDTPPSEPMSEMLPEVEGMGMLPRSAPTPPPESEISVGGVLEPGMGGKDPAPVLAELDVEGLHLANGTFVD